MRAAVATVLAVLAGLLLPVAVVAAWTRADVTDVDGYVATTAPVARDPEVRRALADVLFTQARRVVSSSVAPGATEVTDLVIEQAVAGALRSPAFAAAWAEANRQARGGLLTVLEGGDALVTIDLTQVLGAVLDDLATAALTGSSVEVAAVAYLTVDPHSTITVAQRVCPPLDAVGSGGLVACAALAAGAIALAPRRRRTTRVLGAVATLTTGAALVSLLLAGAQDGVLGAVDTILFRDLRHGMVAALAAGVALGLVTLVPGRQTNRSP